MYLSPVLALLLPLLTATAVAADPQGPDAERGLIALTLRDAAGRLQIFTIRPDGTGDKQLTFDGDNGRPGWSRDGKKITFMSHKGGHVSVAVMDADGSNPKTLCDGLAPDWSPDGKKIAFTRGNQIWTIDADGTNERQVTHTPTTKVGASWSPDGKRMAFILIRNPRSPDDPRPQIGVMNADGTDEKPLTTGRRTNVRVNPDGTTTLLETADDANAPGWSHGSDKIAFWSGIETRYGQIWTINSDGTGGRQLTDDPNHRNSDDPSWSPDDKKIIFSTGRGGRNELWVMDADGKNQKRLHDIDASPFPGRAAWQPVPGGR